MSNLQLVLFYLEGLSKRKVPERCRKFYLGEINYFFPLITTEEIEQLSEEQKLWWTKANKLIEQILRQREEK